MKARAIIACLIFGLSGSVVLLSISSVSNEGMIKTSLQGVMMVAALASVFLWRLLGEISKLENFHSTDLEREKLARHFCEKRQRATWIKFIIYFSSSIFIFILEVFKLDAAIYLVIAGFFCGSSLWAGISMLHDYFVVEGHAKEVAERERHKKRLAEFRPKEPANGH